jgi:hypothetical protein
MKKLSQQFAGALVLLFLVGCATGSPKHRVHQGLVDSPGKTLPRQVVLLPVTITVNEMSAGGVVEKDPAWSSQASTAVREALLGYAGTGARMEMLLLPELTSDQEATIHEHLALFRVVGSSAYTFTGGHVKGWEEKAFDYTLGDGLRFLQERTGASLGLIVLGEDTVSSGGRKAFAVLAASVGVGIPMGHSFLGAGLVELETGNLLWLNVSTSQAWKDLRQSADARAMVDDLFRTYPKPEVRAP